MKTFVRIWLGQMISTLGSGMTGFGLSVWVYQKTGSVTQFAMLSFCLAAPGFLASVFAGPLVDQLSRIRIMLASDVAAGTGTLLIVALLSLHRLSLPYIYAIVSVISICTAFRWPAYSAVVSTLVPRQKLGRANGMIQFSEAGGLVLPPLAAAFLIGVIGMRGVVSIDFATYVIAIGMTVTAALANTVPLPQPSVRNSLLREALYGWKYLRNRSGLMELLVYFAALNFFIGFVSVLATPMVLSFAPVTMLGTVLSVGGCGMLLGALAMSIWGGGKRHVIGILVFGMLAGVGIAIAGLRPSVKLVAVGAFVFYFCLPIINASSQAIWQSQVEANVQGRVFSIRRMIATVSSPLAYVVAGPVAQHVFEPLLAGGRFAVIAGGVFGRGAGRGIGLLLFVVGTLIVFLTLITFLQGNVQHVEGGFSDADPVHSGGGSKRMAAAIGADKRLRFLRHMLFREIRHEGHLGFTDAALPGSSVSFACEELCAPFCGVS